MDLITKLQSLFIIGAALVGLLLGQSTGLGGVSAGLVEPFLMALLFFVFLSVEGQKLREAFKNVRFTLTATLVNFVWTPVFAFLLGLLFFGESVDMRIGLLMLLVTPCTDWYLVFTSLAKGNVALGASILPLNLLLQIVLLPVYLMVFFGGSASIAGGSALPSIAIVLLVPFALAFVCKLLERRGVGGSIVAKLRAWGDNAQLIVLCLAVACMFASESESLFERPDMLLKMLIPLVLFYVVNFMLVRWVGRRLCLSGYDLIPLSFTTLARNSPLALAIGIAAFPNRPLISLALVVGSLIELPSLAVIARAIQKLDSPSKKGKATS